LYVTSVNGSGVGSPVQMDTDSNNPTYQLQSYSFSPDSTKIAWTAQTTAMNPNNPGGGQPEYKLFVSDINNPSQQMMNGYQFNNINEISWSPDSSKIVFQGDSDIYIADTTNNSITSITEGNPQGSEVHFLSNTKVLFRSNSDGKVYLKDLESGDPATVIEPTGTMHRINPSYLSEHPAQRKFILHIFSSDLLNFSLAVVNPDGSVTSVPNSYMSANNLYEPRWLPDGSKFIFRKPNGSGTDIWVANGDGSGTTQLTDSPDADDNNKVFFYPRM
jgi:Tol biopolymer transport system component